MASSLYQQSHMGTATVAAPDLPGHEPTREPAGDRPIFARADCADARWHVRVVLAANPDLAAQSVRVIVDDRTARRILLHTLWADWRDVPMLAAYLAPWLPTMASLEATGADLAAALLAALRRDAEECLKELGTPIGSLPVSLPGPQERAAMRNVRDTTMEWREAIPLPCGQRAGTGARG